jgi:hypothetical protein
MPTICALNNDVDFVQFNCSFSAESETALRASTQCPMHSCQDPCRTITCSTTMLKGPFNHPFTRSVLKKAVLYPIVTFVALNFVFLLTRIMPGDPIKRTIRKSGNLPIDIMYRPIDSRIRTRREPQRARSPRPVHFLFTFSPMIC